jgi:spermidine synthase
MSALFEEIDYRTTPLGAISLRRRRLLSLDRDVYEVMLGDEHLMSSLFTEGEVALTEIGLAATDAPTLDVVVGGLGLGYTAAAALDDPRLRSVVVIDAIEAVIDWHRECLVPLGARLTGDPRCSLVHGDFFAMMTADEASPTQVHAILLDIDHSPRALLNASNGAFYSAEGLSGVARRLTPGGVFAMWSDEAPDPEFEAVMDAVFEACAATVVEFPNPLTGGVSSCTIYTGRRRG